MLVEKDGVLCHNRYLKEGGMPDEKGLVIGDDSVKKDWVIWRWLLLKFSISRLLFLNMIILRIFKILLYDSAK